MIEFISYAGAHMSSGTYFKRAVVRLTTAMYVSRDAALFMAGVTAAEVALVKIHKLFHPGKVLIKP
jgi:hypothetical protein